MPIYKYRLSKYNTNELRKQMKNLKTIITLIAFTLITYTIQAQKTSIKSETLVNEKGELLNAKSYTVKNKVDNEEEIVKKFYYDKDGRLAFQRNYDFEGQLMYDEDGVAIYEYQHDVSSNVTEERYFDEDKYFYQLECSGAAMIKRKFDLDSKMIEISFFINETMPIEFGIASIQFEYSDNGKTTTEKHYNSDGELIDFCAPIVTFEYDNKGRIIKQIFKNAKEEICGRFMEGEEDEVAMIEYVYEGSQLKIQKAFNKNGKLIDTIEA